VDDDLFAERCRQNSVSTGEWWKDVAGNFIAKRLEEAIFSD
jgi:hypothetical protein